MVLESYESSKDLPSVSSVPSNKVILFPLSDSAILAAGAGAYHPFTLQDMLESSSLDTGSSLPGCATLAGEANPPLEYPWMAMKHQAMINVLNRPSSYARGLPDYMPGSLSRSVQDLKMKGKQLVRDCSPPPASSSEQPISPKTCAPQHRFVHLISRASPIYQSPYPPSKSTSGEPSSGDEESMIDELLHKGKEFPTRFIYTAEQLNKIAHCCLIDLIDFFNFYAPGSPQEASARVHLFTQHQGHFNAFLKAAKL
ncbi:hypothetical protein PGT21_001015 [Puccinia graminis f. sp. tritici]|uniref:Uncharacterized protein n=1 Tax=Puccinia graminis f. sp. tritici TaxID=56615 RepID=A0A5B0PWK7_PUCGR|nr:hypothetical protein PGTUg99_004388 [Puccinia graminis f. sp. tritici]KAA1105267.1 hypothetical protein PGT21_001015 [Puccinia graminis f. sp. tritici]